MRQKGSGKILAEETQVVTKSECALQVTVYQYIKTEEQSPCVVSPAAAK